MQDETLTAILRQIVMEPDEDHHRLVYADRLDELGAHPTWATYIRNQIALSPTILLFSDTPEWASLADRVGGSWERGFVNDVRCAAETFLRHADALIWHETQTCVGCYTGGVTNEPDGYTVKIEHQVWGSYDRSEDYPKKPLCRLCRGSRKRPCPDTAQPIRTVTLTRCDDWDEFLTVNDFSVLNTTGVRGGGVWSSPKWPGVTFHLPTGTEAASDDEPWADHEVWG